MSHNAAMAGEYIYCGRIELVDKPYTKTQPGEDGDISNAYLAVVGD